MTSRFYGELDVREREDGTWLLLADLCYTSALIGHVCAPTGFVTDFASVPRLPFMFWWFGDRARKPAVIHDYLYQTGSQPRDVADAVFLEAMESLGVGWIARRSMWAGVRVGGWWSYRRAEERQQAMNPDLPES